MIELGVRAFAKRNNIDINSITGTGKGGRVVKEDVVSALDSRPTGKVLSTPAVRFFAKDNGIDINLIVGTGPRGRVTREDVQAFMKGGAAQSPSQSAFTGNFIGIPAQPPLSGITEDDTVKKITGIKKAMTKTMS